MYINFPLFTFKKLLFVSGGYKQISGEHITIHYNGFFVAQIQKKSMAIPLKNGQVTGQLSMNRLNRSKPYPGNFRPRLHDRIFIKISPNRPNPAIAT
jgi:hypothetical protein